MKGFLNLRPIHISIHIIVATWIKFKYLHHTKKKINNNNNNTIFTFDLSRSYMSFNDINEVNLLHFTLKKKTKKKRKKKDIRFLGPSSALFSEKRFRTKSHFRLNAPS